MKLLLLALLLSSVCFASAKDGLDVESLSISELRQRMESAPDSEKDEWNKIYRTKMLYIKYGGKEEFIEHQKDRIIADRGYRSLLEVFDFQTRLYQILTGKRIGEVEEKLGKESRDTLEQQIQELEEKQNAIVLRYKEVYRPLLLSLASSKKGEELERQAQVFSEKIVPLLMKNPSLEEVSEAVKRTDSFIDYLLQSMKGLPLLSPEDIGRSLDSLPEEELSR